MPFIGHSCRSDGGTTADSTRAASCGCVALTQESEPSLPETLNSDPSTMRGWPRRRIACDVFPVNSPGTMPFGPADTGLSCVFGLRSVETWAAEGHASLQLRPATPKTSSFQRLTLNLQLSTNGITAAREQARRWIFPVSNAKNPWIPESSKRGNSGDQGFSRGRRIQRVIPDTLKCDRAMPESEWIPSRDQASVFFRLTSVRTRSASKAVSNGLRKVSLNSVRSNPLALSSSLIRPTSTVSL